VYTPNYATLEVNLGIVTNRLGQQVIAEQHFARALRLEPNDPATHTFYARWLIEQKKPDDAIAQLTRPIELSPGESTARYRLLDAYAATKRTSELKTLATETLRLVPDDRKVRQYLDERGEARIPTSAATSSAPIDPADTFLNESLRLYQQGDFPGTI